MSSLISGQVAFRKNNDVKTPHLLMLGHLHLDVAAHDLHTYDGGDTFSLARVTASVGGSVAHIARASSGLCRRTALCCVGDDQVGGILERFISDNYEQSIIIRKRSDSVSVVPILYRDNGRELIGPRGSANDLLVPEDLNRPDARSALSAADILIVDGYSAVESSGREACRIALLQANTSGALTVLDIVPHHSSKLYSFEALKQLAEYADTIIVEARTMAQFCGIKLDNCVDEVASMFRTTFPKRLGILRYGERNIRTNRFVSASEDVIHITDDPSTELVSAGYGDRLTLKQVLTLWFSPEQLGLQRELLPWTHRIRA